MITEIDTFIEEARGISIKEAAERMGLTFRKSGHEHPQACPATGGTDRFSFNTEKNSWNCRQCSIGGKDAIGMAGHNLGLDLKRRDGFLEACSAVLGRDIPANGERESDEDRSAREKRIEEARARNAAVAEKRAGDQIDFREKERRKARGIYEAARPIFSMPSSAAHWYLTYRGCGVPDDRWLRFATDQPYWHNQSGGNDGPLFEGPAIVAAFIDRAGLVIGCHITWIDLKQPPKFRPVVRDFVSGENLPSKKMRGTKKGGLIPLCGDPSLRRWLGGEGIENTLAFGKCEGFRADTFYFAAGDLGNMAGPADPKSRFPHPDLKKADKNEVERPVMVAGPVPLYHDGDDPNAMVVADHVDELVLLADGDSERVMTASAMVRARARHARPGRLIPVVWPRPGTDFAAMLAGTSDTVEVGA